MLGGRRQLSVIAEISGAASGGGPWALRREDFDRVETVLQKVGSRRVVAVTGGDDLVRMLAAGLAGAACAAGRRTVLVECDLSRPRLAADLGLSESPGLHEYLRWEATAPDLLQPLALAGSAASANSEPLVCVSAGRLAPDAATLLGLQSFRHMVAKLRSAYDLVVLSGPEIEADPGALGAVAAAADGVLAGISPQQSEGSAQKALRAEVSALPAPLLGAVVVSG